MVKFGAVFKKWWNGPHKGFVRYAVGITAIALVYATFSVPTVLWPGARPILNSDSSAVR